MGSEPSQTAKTENKPAAAITGLAELRRLVLSELKRWSDQLRYDYLTSPELRET